MSRNQKLKWDINIVFILHATHQRYELPFVAAASRREMLNHLVEILDTSKINFFLRECHESEESRVRRLDKFIIFFIKLIRNKYF